MYNHIALRHFSNAMRFDGRASFPLRMTRQYEHPFCNRVHGFVSETSHEDLMPNMSRMFKAWYADSQERTLRWASFERLSCVLLCLRNQAGNLIHISWADAYFANTCIK